MKAFTCTLVAILTMVWPSAAAVALDLTFDDVMSVGNPLVTMLDTHGYRFTGRSGPSTRPAACWRATARPSTWARRSPGPASR